jgi:hypothetical protein
MNLASVRLTNAERADANREIETLQRMRDQVCASIIEAQERINSIELQVLETTFDLTIRRSYLGSMRHVPFEILGHIFQSYLDDNPDHRGARGWLQLVCTKWRDVVLGSPSLWTMIDLVGPFHADQEESYLNHIDACILRSGTRKLDVSFKTYYANILGDEYVTTRILNHLISYVGKRWRSFKYSHGTYPIGFTSETGSDLLTHILENAPSLERVIICHEANLWSLPSFRDLSGRGGSYFNNLKSLRFLQLPSNSWSRLVRDVTLPQITDLVVEGHDWYGNTNSRNTLPTETWVRGFPCLRSLSFRDLTGSPAVIYSEKDMSVTNTYQAKSLTRLILHGPVSFRLLDHVEFPALKVVIIQANNRGFHLFQHPNPIYRMNFEHVSSLRLECHPGTPFWDLGPDNEDFHRVHDEIIPLLFSIFKSLDTVHASGCIWKLFAWIFDIWDHEFLAGAETRCQEVYAIPMEKIRVALQQKVVGRGENWMPLLHPDDESELSERESSPSSDEY